MHSIEVTGPSVNGDQFIVGFKMDITQKESGQRMQMNEMGLFTVKDKKLLDRIAVGKKIDFEFVEQGKDYLVTSVK